MSHIDQVLKLAQRYVELAQRDDIKNPKDLSKLTYALRESGENIPYLAVGTTNVNYFPQPTSKQRSWDWMRQQKFGEGFIGFWVEYFENKEGIYDGKVNGLKIYAYQMQEKNPADANRRTRIELFHQIINK